MVRDLKKDIEFMQQKKVIDDFLKTQEKINQRHYDEGFANGKKFILDQIRKIIEE